MSATGLTARQRVGARKRFKRAAMLAHQHRDRIGYTQGPARWEGIAEHLHAVNGQYPTEADCSSSGSWYGWDATRLYNLFDFMNGDKWLGGYTGTLIRCGARVSGNWLLVGDGVFYGNQGGGIPEHVAWVVHPGPLSRALVVSHGGPSGPLLLKATYRKDINQCRRFIR